MWGWFLPPGAVRHKSSSTGQLFDTGISACPRISTAHIIQCNRLPQERRRGVNPRKQTGAWPRLCVPRGLVTLGFAPAQPTSQQGSCGCWIWSFLKHLF